MRPVILVFACFAAAGAVAAHGEEMGDAADALSRARARGALEFTAYDDFPPYSFRGSNGLPAGVDVDLANALAAKLGLHAQVRLVTPGEDVSDDLRNNVWKGHYLGGGVSDVMLHVPTDPGFADGQPQSLIFGGYFHESVTIAYRESRVLRIDSPQSLAGRKVGLELDTISDHYMSSAYGGRLRTAAVRKPSLSAVVNALRSGEVDAVMGPKGELQGLFAIAGVHDVRYRDPPMQGLFNGAWRIGLAVKKADGAELQAALSQALQELRTDGALAALFTTHHMEYADAETSAAAVAHTDK